LREGPRSKVAIVRSATKHARELRGAGFSIAQVVHDYGNVCQTISALAVETATPFTAAEFRTLNLALDEAIAGAVTEYSRLCESEDTERIGRLSRELRDLVHRATLAFDVIKTGDVGVAGATGEVLGRSLVSLGALIDRELSDVRRGPGPRPSTTFLVRDMLDELEVAATTEARAQAQRFALSVSMDPDVALCADQQTVESVLGNLLHNAFKFTPNGGSIALHAHASETRVLFEVHDGCGGLPPGKAEELLRPIASRGPDRRGLGLGLAICHRGALANGGAITIVDHPGRGCVFTLDLPRYLD
jgi:signal transduction histidine kinase